jgi:hypothetical protein
MFAKLVELSELVDAELRELNNLDAEDLERKLAETTVDVDNIKNLRTFYLEMLIDLKCSLACFARIVKVVPISIAHLQRIPSHAPESESVPSLPMVELAPDDSSDRFGRSILRPRLGSSASGLRTPEAIAILQRIPSHAAESESALRIPSLPMVELSRDAAAPMSRDPSDEFAGLDRSPDAAASDESARFDRSILRRSRSFSGIEASELVARLSTARNIDF